MRNVHKIGDNIYITSNEEIKEGDWYLNNVNLLKCAEIKRRSGCKKIILTTDQELIKDGVQSIVDWFGKNPSFEDIEAVKKELNRDCKIIIPEQETLEEAAERLYPYVNDDTRLLFINGAKWQQERSYSEEDLKLAFNGFKSGKSFKEWFNQNKKKVK